MMMLGHLNALLVTSSKVISGTNLFQERFLTRLDLSNYWTPKLYFKAENGSFLDVPIVGDTDGGQMGGMAVYYCKCHLDLADASY